MTTQFLVLEKMSVFKLNVRRLLEECAWYEALSRRAIIKAREVKRLGCVVFPKNAISHNFINCIKGLEVWPDVKKS